MASPGETKVRHVRIADPIWTGAAQKAQEEGVTISEVVRSLLRDYTAGRLNYRGE